MADDDEKKKRTIVTWPIEPPEPGEIIVKEMTPEEVEAFWRNRYRFRDDG